MPYKIANKKRLWKLVNKETNKVVQRGYNPYDLIEWYHSNHFKSWYNYGRSIYNMVGPKSNKLWT